MSRKKPVKTQHYDKLVEALTRKIDELEREIKRLRRLAKKPAQTEDTEDIVVESKEPYNTCDLCGKGEITESKLKLRNGLVKTFTRCSACGPLGPSGKR